MSSTKVSTTARVTVTLEIGVDSSWDPNCELSQVYRQAKEEALGMLRKRLEGSYKWRIVGDPIVNAISSEVQ